MSLTRTLRVVRAVTGVTAMGALVVAAGATACAGERSQQLRAATDPPPASAMPIVQVPRGTAFGVALREPLSPRTARPGQVFAATLTTPLRTHDGRVVAPEGTAVLGHVVAVEAGGRPVLRLSFDLVETSHGHAELNARVVEVSTGSPAIAYAPGTSAEGAVDSIVYEGRAGIGGGPTVGEPTAESSGPALPEGASIGLVLVDPISIRAAP